MSKTVVYEIPSRESFYQLLHNNPGLIIMKFGAEWCKPCQKIKKQVSTFFSHAPEHVICCDLDVDTNTDVYSHLKSKRMINGIPALLCYRKGTTDCGPDDSVSGSDPHQLEQFFKRCILYEQDCRPK